MKGCSPHKMCDMQNEEKKIDNFNKKKRLKSDVRPSYSAQKMLVITRVFVPPGGPTD